LGISSFMDGIARYQGHREPAPIPRELDAMPVLFAAGACEIGLKGVGGAAVPSGERGTNVRAGRRP
jgi:hypothetical protein